MIRVPTLSMAEVTAGIFLDCILGDPYGWPHPVRAFGWLIKKLEPPLRGIFPKTRRGEMAAGAALAFLVSGAAGIAAWGILKIAGMVHPAVRFAASCVMCFQMLALRSLKVESMKVCDALEAGDVEAARRAVSMIVGRDTERLTREGIIRAAVETVAENASDGVTAPLFYLFLFGPIGGFVYKAVNTMDSMVGYRTSRYQYFGKVAARADDVLNWIPSRLTALAMIAAAFLLPGFSGREAFRVWRRDRRKHKSPNSAQGEAACAGALGVRLAGDAWYFGKICKKQYIGDAAREIETEDIRRANRLMETASALFFLCMACMDCASLLRG